jgi:hypothetical protein
LDEIDLQVKSMISMRLSSNLRTHIGTTSAATWTSSEAPQGESSKKRTRKGAKREKAHKACAAHNIVSSAFIPSMVLNHMQETHYMEAGPSSSRVKEVFEPPKAPTPPSTISVTKTQLAQSHAS